MEPVDQWQKDPWRHMVLGGLEKPWPYGWVLARELPQVWLPFIPKFCRCGKAQVLSERTIVWLEGSSYAHTMRGCPPCQE